MLVLMASVQLIEAEWRIYGSVLFQIIAFWCLLWSHCLNQWSLGTNIREDWIKMQHFLYKKIDLKISYSPWPPFCLGIMGYNDKLDYTLQSMLRNDILVYIYTIIALWNIFQCTILMFNQIASKTVLVIHSIDVFRCLNPQRVNSLELL